jgi:hypothetical protein
VQRNASTPLRPAIAAFVEGHLSVRDCSLMAALSDRVPSIAELVFLALVLVVVPALVQAQESSEGQDQQSQQQKSTNEQTVKPPPSPLFPKHHRGMYKNPLGLRIIDATPQSPPLEIDDPSVPDKDEYEINLTTHADFSKELRTIDFVFVDANYGIVPMIFGHELPTQVKFEFPLAGAKKPDDPMRVGIGAATFGLKVNFFNRPRNGVYVSLYPQIEFTAPGTETVEKGLANPGQTLILPLLVQKDFRHITVVANGAVNKPIHDSKRNTTGTLDFGFGRALNRHVAAMAEVRFISTFDLRRERLLVVNFGLMRSLRDNVVLYANVGRSIFSDGSFGHTYVGVGLKFELTPRE